MRRSTSLALICAGFAATCCAVEVAYGADVPTGVYPQYQPAGVVQEFASGWYLRGDLGWRTDTKIGEVYSSFAIPTGVALKDVATAGGGGGYKWSWFRADVTFDYSGRSRFYTLSNPPGAYDAKVDTLVGLANVYLDLGTWSGLTPYVGIGAGFANFWTHGFTAPQGVVVADSQTKADFAWAYMAGLAWCFAPRWSVDFSYRHLNLGEMTFNPHVANSLTLKDLSANEFRIGLRYNLD